MEQLGTVFQSLWQIVLNVGELAVQLLLLAMHWSLLIAWVAWWLLGVNWTRVWPCCGVRLGAASLINSGERLGVVANCPQRLHARFYHAPKLLVATGCGRHAQRPGILLRLAARTLPLGTSGDQSRSSGSRSRGTWPPSLIQCYKV